MQLFHEKNPQEDEYDSLIVDLILMEVNIDQLNK